MSLDSDTLRWIQELLADAEDSPRVTEWERSFLGDVLARLAERGQALWLSDRQMAVLKRIEEKIHAAG